MHLAAKSLRLGKDDLLGFPKSESGLFHPVVERKTRSTLLMKRIVQSADGDEYSVRHIKLPLLVHLVYLLSPYWEWMITAQICTTYFCITYSFIFALYIPKAYALTWYLDLIFAADTAMRVAIEVWRRATDTHCVIFLVPYTFSQFLLDFLSLAPFERLFINFVDTNSFRALLYFENFRFNRFLRFSRAFKFFSVVVDEGRASPMFMFVVKYLVQYLVFLQFVACFFFFILPAGPLDFMLHRNRKQIAGSWIRTVDRDKPQYGKDHFDHYALSISLATCVVTTTGYGDFSATSSLEMAIMAMVMLTGAIWMSGSFSSGLAAFKLEHDGARFDLFFRVDAIRAYLVNIKAHKIYAQKVIEYYQLLWNYREGVYDVSFMSELPRSVVEDMFYDITTEMFHKSPLFRGLDEAFLREVAGIVHVVIYNPRMILCTTGGYAMSMYYLLQGEVIIKSKLDSRCNGAILRAGCIIGEVNLFFSYPYTTTIETVNCCQLLQIQKFELFNIFENHPHMVSILRARVERRLEKAQEDYETIGTYPVCWVEKRVKEEGNDFSAQFPVEVRSASGFNRLITDDVTDDTNLMIVDMPCLDKSYSKKHTRVFQTCVLPPILSSEDALAYWWNILIMLVSLYSAIMAPYCLHFTSSNEVIHFLCRSDAYLEVFFCGIYFCDIMIEICYSCPVSGIYYKFKDGLSLKIQELTFWFDVASTLPFPLAEMLEIPYLQHVATVVRVLRLWKVLRYFDYLDNARPESLFLFRLVQSLLAIIYSTHLVACYLYSFACATLPGTKTVICQQSSWLRSFTEGKTGFVAEARHDVLGKTEGYWVSFYFACAALTSTGFGDFNPQTRTEMLFLAAVQVLSFCITGYYTALLTSALSCTVRPKLSFQQKLVGVRQFLEHKELNEPLQKRILEHYHLQDHLWKGVNLPENVYHYLYDTPDYINEDAIYLEVELHFDGIPIFTKLDPKLLVSIIKLVRRYLVPPGVVFLRKSEVRRQMYVIGRGSVAVLSDHDPDVPMNIIEETGHFGIRDLLFGEPAHHDIKTLSYCIFFEVELRDLYNAMRGDTDLMDRVDEEKEKLQPGIDAMIHLFSMKTHTTENDHMHDTPSFVVFPNDKKDDKPHCSYAEYEEVFEALRRPALYRFLLMRRAIHPVGFFAKFWTCFMSLVASVTLIMMVQEIFGERRKLSTNILYLVWDIIGCVDIYLKMHWAYYKKTNMFISHPLKTAIRYIFKGEFIFDVFVTTPFELLIPLVTGSSFFGHAKTIGWYTKIRWTRFGQVVRIPAVVVIFHNIFKMRKFLLLTSYILITMFICTIVGSLVETMACPVGQSIYTPGDEDKLPFCKEGTYMQIKKSFGLQTATQRWVVGMYYISQAMFSIGYGDLTTLSVSEMKALIMVCLFGFAILRCILSDITAAEVDIDEVRHNYLEQILCLQLVMYREKVPKKIRNHILSHMYYTWDMSKGLQPRELFRDLHPALEADLFRVLVGDDLTKVPIFGGFRENILRTICQCMHTLFFRKGDRITRYGNMEREMYIIVKGSVWIADKFLVWSATLKSGESFGEASVISEIRRTYNAIAASEVEVFVLAYTDFQTVMQRYPTILSDFKSKLPALNLDIFQSTVVAEKRSEEDIDGISGQIRTFQEQNSEPDPEEEEIFHTVRERWFQSLMTRLFGVGDENEHLPFFYFTRSATFRFLFLIHPKCGFFKYFNSLIVMICYISPPLAAYSIWFAEEIPSTVGMIIQDVTFGIEVPMYMYILIQFFLPFTLVNGVYCKDFKKIVFNYVTRPGAFLLDAVSSIPMEFFGLGALGNAPWRFLGCVRFLRLSLFYRTQIAKGSDIATSVFKYKVSMSMSTFVLVINGIACYFYAIAACSCYNTAKKTGCVDADIPEMCQMGTWTHDFVRTHEVSTIRRLQPWRWYVRSIYWTVTTVSTTGFGDITPINGHEARVAIFTIFCGTFIISVILSSFAAGIASLHKTFREYLYQVTLLLKHMENIGMSSDRIHQVTSYFVMRWEQCRGVKYHECTAVLPTTLGNSVCYFLYSQTASKCVWFTERLDTMFLRQLCGMFSHGMFIPGINIVNDGYLSSEESEDEGILTTGTMYLVYKGRISSYAKNGNGREFLVETYGPGELFAKYSAIFYEMPYNKSYRAETYAEVLGITQNQMVELIRQFPAFALNIRKLILKEYPTVKNASIFHPRPRKEKMKAGVGGLPGIPSDMSDHSHVSHVI